MVSTFTFQGNVESRSSKGGDNIVTGEAELLRINPKRIELILARTGWSKLELGSLNLGVDSSVVHQLGQLQELYFERPELIVYPNGENRIPQLRGGYLYYCAVLSTSNGTRQILVRRAKVKPLTRRIEAYAEVSLRESFGLADDDVIEVTAADNSYNLWAAD